MTRDNPRGPGTVLPGFFERWVTLADNHRNGPRIVIIFAVLVIVAIWLSIGFHLVEQRHGIFTAAQQELKGAIVTLDSHTRRTVEAVNTTLRAVDSWLTETSRQQQPRPLAEVATLIADLQRENEDPVDIRPIDRDGFLFRFDASGGNFHTFVGDREYILALQDQPAGTLYISTPVISRDSKRLVLPIAIKARANLHGIAYLVAAVTVQQFETAYKDLLISAPARIGIARDNGTLLVGIPHDPDLVGKVMPGYSQIAQTRPNALSDTVDLPSTTPGRTAMTTFIYLSRQPLMVFAAFDREDLQQKWLSDAKPQIAAGIAATLLTLLIAGWLRHLMRLKEQETAHVSAALADANAANIAKRQFLANMSHELRTPLNAILGFSEVISTAVFGPLDAQYRSYGGDIHKSGHHLLHLVDQLLDISRIESGAVVLKLQPCDLHDIVSEALKVTLPLAQERQIQHTLNIGDDARHLVSDRGLLRQIAINLLSNATKYNRVAGDVTVSTRRRNDGIALIIEDTGSGIPQDDLVRIFQPFTRGDAWVARTEIEGTGLGLPIVQALISLVGGTITLTSIEHVGTRAELFLPDPSKALVQTA